MADSSTVECNLEMGQETSTQKELGILSISLKIIFSVPPLRVELSCHALQACANVTLPAQAGKKKQI